MAKEKIDAVISAGLSAGLKAQAYRKVGRTWRKVVSPVIKIAHVQGSKWNTQENAEFTINLGIYVLGIPELFGDEPLDKVHVYDALLQERVSKLMPPHVDASASARCPTVASGRRVGRR